MGDSAQEKHAKKSGRGEKGKELLEANVNELMARIRSEVEQEAVTAFSEMPRFEPAAADIHSDSERKAGELRDSEHLRYLNFHHARTLGMNPAAIKTHRKGIVARLVVGMKRRMMTWMADLLQEYFEQEVAYRAHLVRYLNQSASYIDARDSQIFWELIHKIDTDVSNALRRIEAIHLEGQLAGRQVEQRLRDSINRDLGSLRTSCASHEDQIACLERVVGGLESLYALAGQKPEKNSCEGEERLSFQSDPSYVLLENRFRGSEEEIRKRCAHYVELVKDFAPVLEIGCGRGELLELFKAEGITAQGVDFDPMMVDTARSKGLDVMVGNGLAALLQTEDGSLGAVIAIQVVEHLTQADLGALIQLSLQKVRPGGLVIFETINPRSVMALSSNYFRDPTHVWPLHPDTLGFLMKLGGLELVSTDFLSPVSEEARLPEVPQTEFLSPKWQHMVGHLNEVISRLNELLYGYQDYCVVARRPEAPASLEKSESR